ncbi:MAG: tetratricopeptide repeat protein, partial [bacterium]|nr:tetratricopeptide repeat protein [bacterium]
MIYHRQAKNDEALIWCQKCLRISSKIRRRESRQIIAQANYNLAGIYQRRGDLAQAVQFCQKSLQIYQSIEDSVGQIKAYNNMGNSYMDLGEWNQANKAFLHGLTIVTEVGDIQ